MLLFVFQFPFLMGKVLTKLWSLWKPIPPRFPFLIGKVLTIQIRNTWITILVALFPFLIGKVLTIFEYFWDWRKYVSCYFFKCVKFPFLIGKVLTWLVYFEESARRSILVSIPIGKVLTIKSAGISNCGFHLSFHSL